MIHLPLRPILVWCIAAVLLPWVAAEASAAVSDCVDATCRISTPDGSRGTGCVFEIGRGQVFVLTCAHVVGRSTAVQCEFWREGHQSQPLPGRVIARVEDDRCDAAVIAVDESQFGGLLPRVVPLAPRDYVPRPGDTITSVGCANGAWSTGWKGHVLGDRGGDLRFVPVPANGRSGSALFDAAGEKIVGLIRARTIDNSEGIAVTVQELYRALGDKTAWLPGAGTQPPREAASGGPAPVQCPGGTCPAPTPYLLPYRYREQFRNQPQQAPQQQVWPTLPAQPAAPPVDLGSTNQRLDKLLDSQGKIAELLGELRQAGGQIVPPSAGPTSGAAVEQAQESKIRQIAEKVIGEPGTLVERIAARRAKVQAELGDGASEVDIAKAYARDFAKEKLSDGTLGLTAGKIIGGALGFSGPLALALGGGLWLLSRRIGGKLASGEPLLVQSLVGQLSDKIDALKGRVSGTPPASTP
jgi:hypothetical protein